MLELNELKQLHDKAYLKGQIPRERSLDDLVFYWITQWDTSLLDQSQLSYKGEFNILRKAGRQIMADLRANPVQVDFKPLDDNREDDAELLDGLYRTSCRENASIEAFDNASGENVVCGVGAWELFTDYETNRRGDRKQVIKRKPIFESVGTVFFDPNAKLADKSDAMYCSVLEAYSKDGYKNLVKELTGEELESIKVSSFKTPEQVLVFNWLSDDFNIYVSAFFHKAKVKEKILFLTDPFGEEVTLSGDEIKNVMDDLIESGYELTDEKEIEKWQVTKYIASGERILKSFVIPGGHIPVIPVYGERAFVQGTEWYEGVTRLAKDPQRLRNFQLSYLADIVSRSPRNKPMFFAEQVKGFEFMYEENGADNNFPYYLLNRKTKNGEDLPPGPAGNMPEQKVPEALVDSINLSRQAVEDVANPGLPQNIADPDLSGKAVLALQNRLDQQSIVYQQNMKHAKRRDAEIFAAMASEVYDVPRKVMVTLPDGQTKHVEMMQSIIDKETGKIKALHDLTDADFMVYADIGPSFQSKKEETIAKLEGIIEKVAPYNPTLANILIMKLLSMIDGVDFDDVRQYVKKQLITMGIDKPETEEEKQWAAEASQQPQKPDAAMLLAQAEMLKGQAAQMREQRQAVKDLADIQSTEISNKIDAFEAETGRLKVQVEAEKAGAELKMKQVEAFGKAVDRVNPYRAQLH